MVTLEQPPSLSQQPLQISNQYPLKCVYTVSAVIILVFTCIVYDVMI